MELCHCVAASQRIYAATNPSLNFHTAFQLELCKFIAVLNSIQLRQVHHVHAPVEFLNALRKVSEQLYGSLVYSNGHLLSITLLGLLVPEVTSSLLVARLLVAFELGSISKIEIVNTMRVLTRLTKNRVVGRECAVENASLIRVVRCNG